MIERRGASLRRGGNELIFGLGGTSTAQFCGQGRSDFGLDVFQYRKGKGTLMRRRCFVSGLCLALAATAMTSAPTALAADTSRDEFVERAEPICKTNVEAFKGAKGKVKKGKLKSASGHFMRAVRAFGKTVSQLKAVPRPAADEARLRRWFALLEEERLLVEKIGRALAAEQKRKAESFSLDLNRNSNKANNAALAFGFDYCRIEPSRFN